MVTDAHNHRWVKVGGGQPSNQTLRAQCETSQVSEGVCSAKIPEDWWWRPTVSAAVKPAKVQRYNPEINTWQDQAWAKEFGDLDNGSFSSLQPTGKEFAPAAATYSGKAWRGTFTMPPCSAGTQMRVTWPMDTTVTASCDNTNVSLWKQGMHVDTASEISSASTSQDFNLWY